MNIQLTQLSNYENRFKKCHLCNQIWFKFSGSSCFRCGKRSTARDIINKKFKNYSIEYKNYQIIINENGIQPQSLNINDVQFQKVEGKNILCLLSDEEIERNKMLKQMNRTLIQPIGCGNFLGSWNDLEDVTENILFLLGSNLGDNLTDYDSDIDELKLEYKIKQNIIDIKKKYLDLNNKINNKDYQNNDELLKIQIQSNNLDEIIKKYEQYTEIYNKDLEIIKENSSYISDDLVIEKNKYFDYLKKDINSYLKDLK